MKKERFYLVSILLFACVAWIHQINAKNTEEKIKTTIDEIADALKRDADDLGNDLAAAQHYLENYHWKGIVQDSAASEPITLSKLRLNNHSRVAIVHPNEIIEGVVECAFDKNKVSYCTVYRAVIGIHGQGPQTSVGRTMGIHARDTLEKFTLRAPAEPGFYEVRFQTANGFFTQNAWPDESGNEPDATKTIGIIYVKR